MGQVLKWTNYNCMWFDLNAHQSPSVGTCNCNLLHYLLQLIKYQVWTSTIREIHSSVSSCHSVRMRTENSRNLFNRSTFNNREGKPEGRNIEQSRVDGWINPDIFTFHYLLFFYKYILVLFFIVRKMLLTLRYNISNLNCLQDIYIKNNFKLFQNIQKPDKNKITKMLDIW